jgi:biopolymer transport protein ExbD
MMGSTSLSRGRYAAPAHTGTERPQLTSLVDMMVILVVFLLHSFSAEDQFLVPAPGIDLPRSSEQGAAPAGLPLVVGPAGIRLAEQAFSLADSAALKSALVRARESAQELPVAVQVDRGVPFRVLGTVLACCAEAGWPEVQLVVQKETS